MENLFRVQPPAAPPKDIELPAADFDPVIEDDQEDATANLLVIPIHQEIAPDFALIGYHKTIRRMEEILAQRGLQRNVMLYGERGVGKTAILHGLVQRKNRGDLSIHSYKRMFNRLNTSRLLHTDDVQEMNRQFDQVLSECGRYDVLAIENFYTMFSYLRVKGANSVLIGYLEALSRRKLQSIITCTTREKTLILNEIPEMHEYFAPEPVPEPSGDELLNILRGVHGSYEARYGISITDDALCAIHNLTRKYRNGLEDWVQPGRALIVLDRAIAQFSVEMNSKPTELVDLESQADAIRNEIESLTDANRGATVYVPEDEDRRRELETRLEKLKPEIEKKRLQWQESIEPILDAQKEKLDFEERLHRYGVQRRRLRELSNDAVAMAAKGKDQSSVQDAIASLDRSITIANRKIANIESTMAGINLADQRPHIVTDGHIYKTFSEISGIPSGQLTENERERALHLEEILGERVYYQGRALAAVATAVRRSRAKLTKAEERPQGSFLFMGPSGVGKTELGRALAEFETGTEDNLIRFDMSEYMEKHSVARLIGAPPGYAGHEQGGLLTEAVRKKPMSVVMLDEIDKAHEDIQKVLLQVLDAGRLTAGTGETVDFKNTIIVITSNAGSRYFLEMPYEQASQQAMKELEKLLLPEVRGRLDGVICFGVLPPPALIRVAHKRIGQLNDVLHSEHHSHLEIDDGDIQQFCEKYRDDRFGGRVILTSLKTLLEGDLATAILSHTNGGGIYHAKFNGERFSVEFTPNHH